MVNSYGLPECMDWVEDASGWKDAKKAAIKSTGAGKKKGLGIRLLALHLRRLEAGQLDRRAARDGEHEARP